MSRNIILYISISLDGYIAKKDGSVNWLTGTSGDLGIDTGYDDFFSTIDTVVLGRITYEQVINELSPDKWVYEGKKCYVATCKKGFFDDNRVEFVSDGISEVISSLKNQQGKKDIYIVGGGRLIDEFTKKDLIDKYIITIIPTILGDGIPLFLRENPEIKLKLIETKTVDGIVELTYIRSRES